MGFDGADCKWEGACASMMAPFVTMEECHHGDNAGVGVERSIHVEVLPPPT